MTKPTQLWNPKTEQWEPCVLEPCNIELGVSFGDCVSCDGYILNQAEAPHCPTCARLKREGKPLD